MNVLISAPSLDTNNNVSGISSMVSTIMTYSKKNFYHFEIGQTDIGGNGIVNFLTLLLKLLAFPLVLRKNRIDIFHQNLPFNTKGVIREFFFSMLAYVLRIPVVVHIHGGEYLMNKPKNKLILYLAKSIFNISSSIIVLSEIEQASLSINYNRKSIVLKNCVDTRQFALKENIGFEEKPTVLFLGRFHDSKGTLDLIEGFKLAYEKMRFRFFLCGAGAQQDFLVTSFRNILGEDFVFKGVVKGNEKINIIRESDFFILPSRYGEGLPIALLETMSCGVIPIVTDDASMKMVVNHMQNGVRVEKANGIDISEKLIQLFRLSKSELKELAENARKSIEVDFGVENYLQELESIYSKLIR
jgi:glycosyltransferase involved in cell wall biosynthesis